MTVKELKKLLENVNDYYVIVYSDTMAGISDVDIIDIDDTNEWVLLDTL